jgi:hypothetical protein
MSRLFVLAHGDSWDRRYQVSALVASAAVDDRLQIDLALFFGALDAWVRGRWDDHDPDPPLTASRLAQVDFPPLTSLIEPVRTAGRLRVFACSASVKLLGLDTRKVMERVDAILGWQSFSQRLLEAERTVTF